MFFEILSRKFKLVKIGQEPLLADQHTFLIISRSFRFKLRNVSAKNCTENVKKPTYYVQYFVFNLAVYEIIWKNTAEPDRPQMKVSGMHISRWVPKAADVHSECVILNALPLQQWLHESARMLRVMSVIRVVCRGS